MNAGDKIVCIDNDDLSDLTVGKTYTVLEHSKHSYITIKGKIEDFYILFGDLYPGAYHPSRFLPLTKYRKLKLEKLNESNL